jgi:hypothetical protein
VKFSSLARARLIEKLVQKLMSIPLFDDFFLIFFLCFIATFRNISAISWRAVLVVEDAGVHGEEKKKSKKNHQIKGSTLTFEPTFQSDK